MRTDARPSALPPYGTLDPGLAAADRLLGAGEPRLVAVVAALPDEPAAAECLNALLASTGAAPRLVPYDSPAGWRVVLVGEPAPPADLVSAAGALATLVAIGGWHRLKRCATCATAFVDRTNAGSGRRCVRHRRRRHPQPVR